MNPQDTDPLNTKRLGAKTIQAAIYVRSAHSPLP
jgi:hypothetical protein